MPMTGWVCAFAEDLPIAFIRKIVVPKLMCRRKFKFLTKIAHLAIFAVNFTARKIQKLEDAVAEMPKEYVAKDDYRADISEIKAILKQIFDKLDGKADK